jgi:hypothetical protein
LFCLIYLHYFSPFLSLSLPFSFFLFTSILSLSFSHSSFFFCNWNREQKN